MRGWVFRVFAARIDNIFDYYQHLKLASSYSHLLYICYTGGGKCCILGLRGVESVATVTGIITWLVNSTIGYRNNSKHSDSSAMTSVSSFSNLPQYHTSVQNMCSNTIFTTTSRHLFFLGPAGLTGHLNFKSCFIALN